MNTNGFYDKLIEFFEEIIKQNFASNKARNLYYVAQTAEEAIEYIKNYKFENLTVTKADIYKR